MVMEHQEQKRELTDKMRTIELEDEQERTIEQIIIDALVEHRRVRSEAAKSIGISRQLIGRWIKVLNIDFNNIRPKDHSRWQEETEE